jgi:hypothetical protein
MSSEISVAETRRWRRPTADRDFESAASTPPLSRPGPLVRRLSFVSFFFGHGAVAIAAGDAFFCRGVDDFVALPLWQILVGIARRFFWISGAHGTSSSSSISN